MAGVAEFLAGIVEGGGHDREEDFAFGAAYEIEAALLLDELELGRHAGRVIGRVRARSNVRGKIPTLPATPSGTQTTRTNRGWGTLPKRRPRQSPTESGQAAAAT